MRTNETMPVQFRSWFHRLPWVLGLLVLAVVWGCDTDPGPEAANQAPVTYLAIQGADLDTSHYEQILHWWGSDPDGEVVGYCIGWSGTWEPPEDAILCQIHDTIPTYFTQATTDTFVVPLGADFGEREFVVYAVDNNALADPNGKSQVFRLRNWEPELFWSLDVDRPSLSLPAVSFAWSPRDLDGRHTVSEYHIWLDGQDSTRAIVTSDTLYAFSVEDFDSRWGERTMYVKAFDEAQAPSNTLTHTWVVEEPPDADFLLIDNVDSDTPGANVEDAYFRELLDELQSSGDGTYFVYDVEERGNFRSELEIIPLFELFSGIVWYGGAPRVSNDLNVFANLATAEDGISQYIDDGGHLVIVYRDAVGDSAGLTPEFAEEEFGIVNYIRDENGDHNIRLRSGSLVTSNLLEAPNDTLQTRGTTTTADFLLVDSDIEPLLWVEPAFFDTTYTPDQSKIPAYLGIESHRSEGNLAVVTFLLARADRRDNHIDTGVALLRKVFGLE